MSGAYVKRFLHTSSGGQSNCQAPGVWDPWSGNPEQASEGGRYSCYKACPSDFPYPAKDKCYQYPANYNPNPAPTPPPPASQGGGGGSGSSSNTPSRPADGSSYTPPNPANGSGSSGDHGGTTSGGNSNSVAPPAGYQDRYDTAGNYNNVFYQDDSLTNAPADVGAGVDSGSSSSSSKMDTTTMLLIGGAVLAGVLVMKSMKK